MSGASLCLKICLLAFLLSLACHANEKTPAEEAPPKAGTVVKGLPTEIDPDDRYLFYLHGAIIETQGLRPKHPRFGVYEYQAILDSLAARELVVISEARQAGTDVAEYAQKVVHQIETLLSAGVLPERISVVGHSKGGTIAILTSSFLKNDRVNFAFLACCGDWMLENPAVDLHGRILSIYEASDDWAGSCQKAFDKTTHSLLTREIEIQTGLGHGAFYRPISEWVKPVVAWVRGADNSSKME
jgi:hypothetical protein